jgi:peptidyl-dipeptidase Dcp
MKLKKHLSRVKVSLAGVLLLLPILSINSLLVPDSGTTNNPSKMTENPLLRPSSLPFEAPDFTAIKNEHFLPAYEAGMIEALAEIEVIANLSESPTFDNTIVAMEKSGALLGRVSRIFSNLSSANTDPEIQAIQRELSPKLAAHSDNIMLNDKLFARIKSLHDSIDELGINEEERQVLLRYYRNFVRAGAQLSSAEKDRIRQINERLSSLSTQFNQNVLELSRERAVVVDDIALLDGLSQVQIAAAAQVASQRGLEGKYVLNITNTTRQPILSSLNNRELRQRVWEASAYRGLGENGGIDNTPIILELARLRAERSKILGFETFAHFAVQTQMAETPDNVINMLTNLLPAVKRNTENEAEAIKAAMLADGIEGDLQPWDWEYFAEKVRKARYDIDENEVKPYFELESVLNNGVFYTMNRLYGVTFRERTDLPVYHETVRVWDVVDSNGETMAIFYGDFYARDSKRGGAWMSSYVPQSHLLGTKPVVVNVLNIPAPAPGEPTLVSFDNVVTLFHEMGHGVHGMFSDVKYPSVSGTSVPRDFVEFPSTFEEDWAIHPEVLQNYARHYETGEPLPKALLDKVIAANTFNQGFDTFEYIAASLLDMEWHMISENEIPSDLSSFEQQALSKYGLDWAFVPPRYKTAYFSHIWSVGYSASYYAYLWSEVLAADAFAYIQSKGGLTLENGLDYRQKILSRGGSGDPMQTYINFRGKEPSVDALLKRRGLNTTVETEKAL